MNPWPVTRLQNLFNIELPIVQAPMAGSDSPELAIEVSEAGGLGSLGCALLNLDQIRQSFISIRKCTTRPINLNFFCHQPPPIDRDSEKTWIHRLEKFYLELGLDLTQIPPSPSRTPFSEDICTLVEELRPEVTSFHFGLPHPQLVQRLKHAGIKIISSATTVEEARWLEQHGCDAVVAQGLEAGGHRGMFLHKDVTSQVGTMALIPQVVDALKVPVIAAGGIADARGIVAALALGASGVQIGTAFLFCPEAHVSPLYREALKKAKDRSTVITNVFSGRPARGIINRFIQEVGPLSDLAPPFPLAGSAVGPLRKKSEANGSLDFMQLWSGQASRLCREMPARQLIRILTEETLGRLSRS